MKRPLAYITAAWLSGDSENAEQAARYCRAVYEAGFSPICPPLYLPLFLNDAVPEEHAGIWAFIGKLPFAQILIPITLFIMLISFSTSADNSVSAISALCTQNSKIGDEAPSILKILWGVAIGVLAYLLMAYAAGTKGNDGVRYMVVAIGSVLSIFIILMIASTVKMFFVDKKTSQKRE